MVYAEETAAFMTEFEALKARHGAAFADVQAVRFTAGGEPIDRDFVPYFCRVDTNGFIQCEKERPV